MIDHDTAPAEVVKALTPYFSPPENRSGLAWFLVSLVLGPIATLLIVVLERNAPSDGKKPFKLQDSRR